MNEEEFLGRTLNKIAKEFGYDVASTLELMFIKKEKELDQYKNNWEELKEYLNNGINYWKEQEKEWIEQGFMKFGGEANTKIIYQGILNKMKELEEDK